MGRAYVEREGVSVRHAARFLLVGTMNPEEGELRPQLLDRFGLTVEVAASRDPAARAEVVRRRLAVRRRPGRVRRAAGPTPTPSSPRGSAAARDRLRRVLLPDAALRQIAEVCAAFDVDGMRADIVTARTAVAHAAWQGRDRGHRGRRPGRRPAGPAAPPPPRPVRHPRAGREAPRRGVAARPGRPPRRRPADGPDDPADGPGRSARSAGGPPAGGRRRWRRPDAAGGPRATRRRPDDHGAADGPTSRLGGRRPDVPTTAAGRRRRRRGRPGRTTAGGDRPGPGPARPGRRRRPDPGDRGGTSSVAVPRRGCGPVLTAPASATACRAAVAGPDRAGPDHRRARCPPAGRPRCTCRPRCAPPPRTRPAGAAAAGRLLLRRGRPAGGGPRGPRGQPGAVRRRRQRLDGRPAADGAR